jgi:hypothetical protein
MEKVLPVNNEVMVHFKILKATTFFEIMRYQRPFEAGIWYHPLLKDLDLSLFYNRNYYFHTHYSTVL